MMHKLKAAKEDCVFFYGNGWRYGKIIEKQSDTRMIVQDCTGEKFEVVKNDKEKWGVPVDKVFR